MNLDHLKVLLTFISMTDVEDSWTDIQFGQHEADWIGIETISSLSTSDWVGTTPEYNSVEDVVKPLQVVEKYINQNWGIIQNESDINLHFPQFRLRWEILFGIKLPDCIPSHLYFAIMQIMINSAAANYLIRYRIDTAINKKYVELLELIFNWKRIINNYI